MVLGDVMEQFWEKAVVQAPALAVLVFLVIVFLRHLRYLEDLCTARDIRQQEQDKARLLMLEKLGESCHLHQKEMQVQSERAFDKVTGALDRNTAALAKNDASNDRVARAMEKQG